MPCEVMRGERQGITVRLVPPAVAMPASERRRRQDAMATSPRSRIAAPTIQGGIRETISPANIS